MIFKHPDHLQFLIDKISDEDVSSINIITSRNVLPLIEKIEVLNIKTINIYPSVNQDLIEPSDIFVVFDDIELLDSDIGIIKNILSQKIILFSNNKDLDESMRKLGFDLPVLNIGGGFPIPLTKPVPLFSSISEAITEELKAIKANINIFAEPGRYLVGESGFLATKVIGISVRNKKKWVYLDAGVFNGLIEFSQGLNYPIYSNKKGDYEPVILAGPTCDSVDIISKDIQLPSNLAEDDLLVFINAGAYTSAYSSNFNGFPLTHFEFI